MIDRTKRKPQTREVEEISTYRHPPQGFVKLNFDKVAKGNPGEAGIGGVIQERWWNHLENLCDGLRRRNKK